MRDVAEPMARWVADGNAVAVAVVTDTWGSSPRRVGSVLAIGPDGTFHGSVSAGCVENAVITEAAALFQEGPEASPRNLEYGVTNETAWSVGLTCGGELEVLLALLHHPEWGDGFRQGLLSFLCAIGDEGEEGAVLFPETDGARPVVAWTSGQGSEVHGAEPALARKLIARVRGGESRRVDLDAESAGLSEIPSLQLPVSSDQRGRQDAGAPSAPDHRGRQDAGAPSASDQRGESGDSRSREGDPASPGAAGTHLSRDGVADSAGGAAAGFLLAIPARPHLLIFGANHIAVPLVSLARQLGFRITVIDPRSAFADPKRFPVPPDEIRSMWPQKALTNIALGPHTYAAVLSHDPKIDDAALEILLASEARYIGALGSRKSQAARRRRMSDLGFTGDQVERIHGPIGIPIHSQSPAEIALSILSEIVSIKNRKT